MRKSGPGFLAKVGILISKFGSSHDVFEALEVSPEDEVVCKARKLCPADTTGKDFGRFTTIA